MFSTNHKTVFVLDHTPYFGVSSDFPIDLDQTKHRNQGSVPLPPICKSLWTCSVEAAVEYCRIVWDLFPDGKLIRFIVSEAAARILNTWSTSQQNLNHIFNSLSLVGGVRQGAGGDVVGLRAAIDVVGEPSPEQSNLSKDRMPSNRGRIICITSARDDASLRSLADIALNSILHHNKKVISAQSNSVEQIQALQIQHIHLVIINVTPEKTETLVNNQPLVEIGNGVVAVEVRVTRASNLAALLGKLVLPHYNLATTTVTGIPMKEEQNASSSANYDVDIIHSIEAHAGLRATQTAAEALENVVLRWWTPRGSEGTGACGGQLWRVTPADVASRPSACLVNFLLNGRSVTLEVPRRGARAASHVLAAQGGELWIGAVAGRVPHDDPPALSDAVGGRPTDYRIKDFGALMQQNKLAPNRKSNGPMRAKAKLMRFTAYWPLTISSTLIFNMGPVVEPLLRLMVQETITEEEVGACRAILCALEARSEPPSAHLPPSLRSKWSGVRREEQWRQVWGELEALLRNAPNAAKIATVLAEVAEPQNRASVIRSNTDSPMSPPSLQQINAPLNPTINDTSKTSQGILSQWLDPPRPPSREFAGRLESEGKTAVLYKVIMQREAEAACDQGESLIDVKVSGVK